MKCFTVRSFNENQDMTVDFYVSLNAVREMDSFWEVHILPNTRIVKLTEIKYMKLSISISKRPSPISSRKVYSCYNEQHMFNKT